MLVPVIEAAASEHKNIVVPASSSTVTNFLVGCAASKTSRLTCSSVMPRAFAVSGICF
jgi:aspartokinase